MTVRWQNDLEADEEEEEEEDEEEGDTVQAYWKKHLSTDDPGFPESGVVMNDDTTGDGKYFATVPALQLE